MEACSTFHVRLYYTAHTMDIIRQECFCREETCAAMGDV